MKLTVQKRTVERKSDNKKLRREGMIPAIIYSKGEPGETLTVSTAEFSALLRTIEKGSLPNTVLTLSGEGKDRKAICKGIQYNPTSYNVIHLDFEELHDDVKVNVKVPLRFTGAMECAGVKLGGILRPVIRHVRVECLPKDMPKEFALDVADLEIKQTRRLSDIVMAEGIRPLVDLHEVAVVVAKR